MRIALGLALDAALICLFAAIGRRSHGETGAVHGLTILLGWRALAALITRHTLMSERP